MWDEVYMYLKLHPWQFNITWAQHFPNFQKITPIVMGISHSQYIKLQKPSLYIWYGCGMMSMETCSVNHDITTSLRLSTSPIFQKNHPHLHKHISPHANPHHIKMLSKPFQFIWYRLGVQLLGVWSLNHDILASLVLCHTPVFQKSPPTADTYQLRVHPHANLHHIKVLKPFLYVQYEWGVQSLGVWSLNHDITITTSLGLSTSPIFQKITPICTGIS